jgi:PAS domain S-box-containing protein
LDKESCREIFASESKEIENSVRILHVDDDFSLLEISKAVLSEANPNFTIDLTFTVDDAFRKLAKDNYDVIISDYEMPEQNGLDFLRKVKEKGLQIPFILFTGKGREEIAIKALNLGAEGYYNKQGNPQTVYGELAHGITMVVNANKSNLALKELKQKIESMIDQSPSVFELYNKDGIQIRVNPAWDKVYQLPREYTLGKYNVLTNKQLIDNGWIKYIQRAYAGEIVEDVPEVEYDIAKDPEAKGVGRKRWINSKLYPTKDKDGQIDGIVIMHEDVTERKKAEEKLKQSDMIFKNSLDMFCVAGFDGYFKVLNPAWSTTLGWSNEELMYRPWLELVYPEDKEKTEKATENLRQGNQVVRFQNRYFCKDGTIRWLSWSAVVYPAENIIFGVARDITEQKRAEKKLEDVNEKLRVIGKLTRHDVRNKLLMINNYSYLLKKKLGADPEIIKNIEAIESASYLADRLFEFGKFYEQIGVEEQKEINIEQYFNEAVALTANLGKIEIICDCKNVTVMADSLLLKVFYNLIDNSLKHGNKVKKIKLSCITNGGTMKLIYTDDGVGIPKTKKTKLFTEGFTTGKGTGLGLSIIQKILQVYGWTITEEGKPGFGVEFVIRIPTC